MSMCEKERGRVCERKSKRERITKCWKLTWLDRQIQIRHIDQSIDRVIDKSINRHKDRPAN